MMGGTRAEGGDRKLTVRRFRVAYRRDVVRFLGISQMPGLGRFPWVAISQPSKQAMIIYRTQAAIEMTRSRRPAWLLYRLNLFVTGAEFGPGRVVGPGLVMHHPIGVIAGTEVTVGRDCTVLSRVTLGARSVTAERAGVPMPTVGDRATIGTGALIIGGVHIGDGAPIGANAVVLDDVPSGMTAVGVPAQNVCSPQ
jgi:serine O-acetyltransferase